MDKRGWSLHKHAWLSFKCLIWFRFSSSKSNNRMNRRSRSLWGLTCLQKLAPEQLRYWPTTIKWEFKSIYQTRLLLRRHTGQWTSFVWWLKGRLGWKSLCRSSRITFGLKARTRGRKFNKLRVSLALWEKSTHTSTLGWERCYSPKCLGTGPKRIYRHSAGTPRKMPR